jgi:transcriptional regulator with XRE-family HTH domain
LTDEVNGATLLTVTDNRRATRPLAMLLRELRQEQGASLRDAARALGVDPSYLSRLERGHKPASSGVLSKASALYNVSEEVLALAEGRVPMDVVEILQAHPELIPELRSRYGSG